MAALWLVVTAYALTGGADFGGGVWDLLAGGPERGRRCRAHIDRSIAPVWEANHVWLIISLVILWTAFPAAFAAIMSTLFIPLSLAAFGVLARGAGFALRQTARSVRAQQLTGGLFAVASLVTPFFMGAALGGIVTGRVQIAGPANRVTSWTSPTCVVLGILSVASFAFLAAVYLTADARRRDPDLVAYFSRRALISGVLVGGLAGLSLFQLDGSATRIVDRLTDGAGLALLVVSGVLGTAVLTCIAWRATRWIRPLAAGAFAAIIWGWGVSQWPALLPPSLTVPTAAAPPTTLITELVIVGVIVVVVGPAFVLLFRLASRDLLAEEQTGIEQGKTVVK